MDNPAKGGLSGMGRLWSSIKHSVTLQCLRLKSRLHSIFTQKQGWKAALGAMLTLHPQTTADYYTIGRLWIYKKLVFVCTVGICGAIIWYVAAFAPALSGTKAQAVKTTVDFAYNDLRLADFTGVANIYAADGGLVYTGDIVDGVCEGQGTLWDRKGSLVYEGTFSQNQYHGNGVQYDSSGKKLYEGAFAYNQYGGTGTLYDETGGIRYKGMFQQGSFSGAGMAYNLAGGILYEGSFLEGAYHGEGTLFYEDGVMQYQGMFYKGKPQGKGVLYSKTGKQLYQGDMLGGQINYGSLLASNLYEVEQAFAETPKVYFSSQSTVFVYEQTGVMLTLDARVRVSEWIAPAKDGTAEDMYFLPNSSIPADNSFPAISTDITDISIPSLPYDVSDGGLDFPSDTEFPSISDVPFSSSSSSAPLEEGMLGYVPSSSSSLNSLLEDIFNSKNDPTGGTGLLPMDGSSSSQLWEYQFSDNASAGNAPSSLQEAATGSGIFQPAALGGVNADFVQKQLTLAFEIDNNLWQWEKDLDKRKVQIKKVTVLGLDSQAPTPEGSFLGGDYPLTLEDCVAIEYIRQTQPAAFADIGYEMLRQNRLFVPVEKIPTEDKLQQQIYVQDGLTHRFVYHGDNSRKAAYYVVEE